MLYMQFNGNIGQDADVKQVGQRSVINFSVAVNHGKERTTWVRCAYWRDNDKTKIADYLKKGTTVIVRGEPSVRAWNDSGGNANSALECNVYELNFGGGQQQSSSPSQPRPDNRTHTTPETMEEGDGLPF